MGMINSSGLLVSRQLLAPLLDQLVCSQAKWLILNVFSTFSQLAMGFIGLKSGHQIGWVRDLKMEEQAVAGVNISFWQRQPGEAFA